MKRNENAEEISKSSEKNDKLMHLVVTEDLSGGQSLSTSTYCGKGSRKKTKFENGSIEVVDVQYNLVKTKDGSAVVENNCNMILHIDENSLSGENSEESCFVVAVEGNITHNFKNEKWQAEKCSKELNKSIVMFDDVELNKTHNPDIQDFTSVDCSNLKNSTHKELVVNGMGNDHELNTVIKKHEHTSGVQGLFEEVECLKPSVNKDMKSDIICDVKATSIKETIVKVEKPSKSDNISIIKIDKPKDCSSNTNNSTASNIVEGVIIPDSPNHSKTFSKIVTCPDIKSVDNQNNSKSTVNTHYKNNILITKECRPDRNEASSLVKELAKVSFLYQGKLVRRSSESSSSVMDESTDDVKEYDVDTIRTESNANSTQSLKQSEPRETNNSNLSNNIGNSSSKMNTAHDHLVVNDKIVISKTNNNVISDEESGKGTSDVSRRSSSDFLNDSSEDGEDFLGTDEEIDMKDQLFIGFNEVTEKLQSRRRSFHQFLNRLSESESEEWYISAGNLSMNFQKVERISSDKLLSKHHVHHNGETDKTKTANKTTTNFSSNKLERKLNCELNYCMVDQDNATSTHKIQSHLNNRSLKNSNLSVSHNSSNKKVSSEIMLYNKEKNLTREKVNKQSNNIECIKTELNSEGNNNQSLLNEKHQLGSETKEHMEEKSKSGSKYEIVNSQLKERKSPQKHNFLRIRNNCDNTNQNKKHIDKNCSPLSGLIMNNISERSNLDRSELSASLLLNNTNSSEPSHVTTEVPKNGDNSVWKCQSDGSDNRSKIKDHFDAREDQSCNRSSDQNPNHNLNHSLKNNTNCSIGSNIVNHLKKESNTQTIEPKANDEKVQDEIQRIPFPSTPEMELSNSEIKLSQEVLVKEDKSKTGKDSQLFLVKNYVRSKKEISVTAINASERDKINNIVSSTPKKRGRKPKIQDVFEECSVLESGKSVLENPSFEENKSPYFENMKTKISTEKNKNESVTGGTNEEDSSALETIKFLFKGQGSEENKPLLSKGGKVEAGIKSSHEENVIDENCMDGNAINKENIRNVSVSPKKRGRPPKAKNHIVEHSFTGANDNSMHENLMVVEEPHPLPKKRGRKPKLKCEEGSLLETNLNPIYKNAINEEESLILPKRRGRKPKAKHFVEDVVAGKKPTGENSVHEELQKEVTCSDLEYSINIKRDCKFSKDTSEVCELNLVSSHKKRGRPPKNKFPNNINTSKQEENFITEDTNKESSILKKYNEEEMLLSIYSEEADMLLRDGSLQRINVDEGETLNSNIQTINVLPNVVKRKRGRPPKSQTTCVPLEHLENLNESLNNTILESRDRESDVLLPKKRGRPPKKRLVPHEPMIPELEQVESLPLSDRFKITEKSDLKKRKRKAEGNLSDPGTELLDTDVIFINREKLTDSLHSKFEKRRGRPKKNSQKATDKSFTTNDFEEINSDSDTSEEIWHESEDTDFEDIPKKKKRKGKAFFKYIKQDDDEDNSDKEQTKERGIKKQTGNRKPSEEQIFFAKHSNNDMVVCGVCKKEMNYKTYKTHHSVFTHYALCWLEGEEKPVDMTDDKEVVNRLWYSKKKLGKTPFRCFNCNLPKLSAVGFQSHIRFCGKEHEMESLMATCQECGATMKPSSLRPHMYIKHSTKSKAGSVDTSSIIPKVKRAAASKADEVLQNSKDDHELEGQLEDKSEGQSQWRPNSPQLRQMQHFYIKPNKIIPKEETERWKTSLRETNVVTCRHPDCTFSAITTIAFRKHYFSCPFFPPKLVYKCRQCQFVSEEEVAVQEHLMQEHRELLQPSPSSSIESGSESDEGSDEERTKMQKYRYNLSLPFKFLQNGFIKYKCRSHPKRFFFSDALLWTNKMRCENLTSDVLFPDAVGTARALAVSQVSQYLPTTASSIKFRGSDGSWRSLNCFQATLVDGVPVMFTGGPVWACAWAAVPDTEDNQYLAVASHPDMNLTHEMSAVYSYPSVIQVWAVGRLVNCLPKPESDNEPQFLMGIAHSRGAVWGLQWCPSGCYQDNRLGLLAAACSDGSVVIYSIPRHQPTSQHKICEMEPVMELKLGCEMLSQCKCIEWHTVAPHSIIVGGFANGMVALWDLHTTSPLLRDGKVIYPFKVFEAHLSAVTAVSLSPTAETTRAHLMTSSLDRATKFWRLDDTTAPVNTLRKASVTDAVMPSTWMTSINAFDDVYSTNSTHIMGYSYRETFTSNNTNFYPQLGTVWGVSFNEWINAIACGSEMGKLTVLFRRQLLVTEDSKKVKSNSMRDDLIMCSVQPLSDVKGNVEIGERYQDCVNNVGLDISFKGNAGAVKKPTEASVDTMENYPILSINKVTWNTNYNSFTWLAAGLQCGLVMAPHVTCLQANDLSELYQQHDGR
ncbi:uncharacterized protein LOC124363050 [Homalodisca vitripennis]|uniref:uncharacterized protein LOC124363050 n=1 Tax=Homalodisca vitripennis TaxID=197043 RepID=UPI001EEB3DE3|nr:uncharacterized protein LOC124363050 [Homalodisca vitripennis]